MLNGFTDNYIHVYCSVPQDQAEKYLNGFAFVLLKEIHEDGLLGEIV